MERQEQFLKWWDENVNVYKVYVLQWTHNNIVKSLTAYTTLQDLISYTTHNGAFYFTDINNSVHVFGADFARECKFTFYELESSK